MIHCSTKLFFSLIPIGGSFPFLLNSIVSNKLSESYPHWNKLIEVWFYGKGKAENETIKIKVWIDNLNDISKSQYFDKDKWNTIGNNKKYSYLADLAKYYLLTQHKINVLSNTRWLSKDEEQVQIESIKCTSCEKNQCPEKTELGCFLKCCQTQGECNNKQEIIKDQKAFAAYLTNIYSAWNNTYLQPVQAHIYLVGEVNLNSDEDIDKKVKKLIGTTIYGFTDYQYKEKQNPDLSAYKDLIKEDRKNKKYFINYPISFNLEKNGKKDLKKIYEELEKTNTYKKENHTHQATECDNLQCLISNNYVKSIDTLNLPFKDIENCK